MPKNIVVGIDGTWNAANHQSGGQTNISDLLSWVSPQGQTKAYFNGVGSGQLPLGRVFYGISGRGVFNLARCAWGFVHQNFQAGDRIFIFGFSRGAFAARHLASMIVRRGIRGWQGDLEDEFRKWLLEMRHPCTMVQQQVHMLGLFDCVPANQLYVLRDRSSYLNAGHLEPGIDHVRHAVAIHERRWSYRPIIFERPEDRDIRQHWFPGCHSDVGGGRDCASGLAAFSLWWMLREAHGVGLDLNHVVCPQHPHGAALNVIQAVDTREAPKRSDWITTRLGWALDRQNMPEASLVDGTPEFLDLDVCYRCQHEMYDALSTPDAQRRLTTMGFGTGSAR
ncbi:peptidoglycan binding domain protein 2 [Burkholderia pseudomallei]|uniref:phospholipase effector Tle1 domain-containing protein n=1 Tax=Burkholderia pseudomallei TaxID=28450 RepID=UPI0009764DF6|nr:DUF2235 domain-containing protein [Burkholderia pseudomallei]MBD2953684.1 DUF2235 domain-containing protein [Burkholderia pseudomallei]MBD2972051.1 DUF2235 domain-containing protein [Burkholderia pseudomallei]MBO2978695.1 DUF2235 domain-containing protein [Burkholderia pseudomallei]MCW0024660.1 DUF2235 domain-containing protein [Burkholderia pseudomallei]MCW0156037.1 DUF2235 domain-containing protein [Burkholderia pseudomallei]